MSVTVNIELLKGFEKEAIQLSSAFIDVLGAVKRCQDSIGEGSGIEESINRDGVALEKAYNEEVVPALQTTLGTLAASADNAEEIQKVMAQFDTVSTSTIAEGEVKQGVRHAAFGRG